MSNFLGSVHILYTELCFFYRNNLENYYAFQVFILQIFNPISEHAVAVVRIDAGIFVDAAVG